MSIGDFLAGDFFPEGADGFLIGDAVVRVVGFCFFHIPEEMDAEVAVKTVVLDIAGHMGHIVGGTDGPDPGGELHKNALLIPGVFSAEGFEHIGGILRGQGFRIAVPAAGVDPERPGDAGGRIIDQQVLAARERGLDIIEPVQQADFAAVRRGGCHRG